MTKRTSKLQSAVSTASSNTTTAYVAEGFFGVIVNINNNFITLPNKTKVTLVHPLSPAQVTKVIKLMLDSGDMTPIVSSSSETISLDDI